MFEDMYASLTELKAEDRIRLAQFFMKTNELMKQKVMYNELQITYFTNPSPEVLARLEGIQSTVIEPMSTSLKREIIEIMKDSIDIEGLKGLLPMIVAGALRYINVPVVLTILGLKPDEIKEMALMVKDYLSFD